MKRPSFSEEQVACVRSGWPGLGRRSSMRAGRFNLPGSTALSVSKIGSGAKQHGQLAEHGALPRVELRLMPRPQCGR